MGAGGKEGGPKERERWAEATQRGCESSCHVEAVAGSDITARRQTGQNPPALSVFVV